MMTTATIPNTRRRSPLIRIPASLMSLFCALPREGTGAVGDRELHTGPGCLEVPGDEEEDKALLHAGLDPQIERRVAAKIGGIAETEPGHGGHEPLHLVGLVRHGRLHGLVVDGSSEPVLTGERVVGDRG